MAQVYHYNALRRVIEGPGLSEAGYAVPSPFEAVTMCELFQALFMAGVTAGRRSRRVPSNAARRKHYLERLKASADAALEQRLEAVLRALANAGGTISTEHIRATVGGKNSLIVDALHKLEAVGGAVRTYHGKRPCGWRITDKGTATLLALVKSEPIEGPNDYYGRAFSNGAEGAD